MVVCLLVVLGFAGLAADTGHIYLIKRNVQNAADAAALAAGKQFAATNASQASPPANSNAAAPNAAHGFAANNGYTTTLGTSCDTASSTSFSTTWVDTGSCSSTSGANTIITIHDPPVTGPDGTPAPTVCARTGNYNCFQVTIQTKVRNYIMGVFGFTTTTVTASAVVNATPQGGGFATPPATAVYLYEPASAFDTAHAPSRSNLACAAGTTSGTVACPTFWIEQGAQVIINGIDGTNLNPSTDTVALQSAGHMLIQGQTTICDPYGAYACPNNNTPASGKSLLGFAMATGSIDYCQQRHGNGAACTTTGQTNLQPLSGNSTTYAAQSWSPSVDLTGLADCSSLDLVLNGETVASDTTGLACAPAASTPYTIEPGKYHSITINHGQYEFGSGLFDITGTAPVNSTGPTSGCGGSHAYTANGIDHCREQSGHDPDLCNNSAQSALACSTMTAGIWIGHGGGNFTAFVSGTSSSCSGGSAGTDGGGGDNSVVTGSDVSFKFESTSAGFVSTNEAQLVTLSAPGPGAQDAVNDVPLLFDNENTTSFIHLDASNSPPSNSFSQFSGIIYQTTSATAGGVEMNAALSHNNGGGVLGQIIAYSFAAWGNGTAVDFTGGFGSSAPKISTSGNAENSVIGTPAPAISAAVDHSGNAIAGYETFTVNYTDEWALDGYDTYIRVNGASPVFFSQNEWGPQPGSGAALPPEGPTGNNNPNDYTGPPVAAAWPVYPTSQSTVTYPNAATAGYTAYLNSTTTKYDDWVETLGSGANTSYFETLGSWTWGHEKDISGSSSASYTAAIKYTFPTPAGSSVTLSIFLTDGDHCGDYATATYTFANISGSGGGGQTGGTVELLE